MTTRSTRANSNPRSSLIPRHPPPITPPRRAAQLALGPVSRILFLPLARDSAVISLKSLAELVASMPARLRPRAKTDAAYPWLWDGPSSHLFCLAPEGVFRAADVAVGAVGSYPTFSPLLPDEVKSEGESESGFPPPLLPLPSTPPHSGLFSVTLSVDAP